MKVIISSRDPLEQALRVLGAMYGLTLAVSTPAGAKEPRARTSRGTPGAARKAARVSRSRKSTSPRRSRAARSGAAPAVSNAELRDWARQHGYTVAGRGRLPREVVAAYQAAQQG